MTATKSQIDYIDILSSYPSTKKADKKDIADFLQSFSKDSLEELTIKEASDLIKILLKRDVEYTFVCGKKAMISKQEYNYFNILGEIEACMHACPDPKIKGDMHSCPDFINFYKNQS